MSWAREQIADLIASAPPGSRVQIVVNLSPEGPALSRHELRTQPDGQRRLGGTTGNRPRLSTAVLIRWLEKEMKERPALDFCHDILSSAEVSKRIVYAGYAPVRGKAIHSFLKAAGFTKFKLIKGPGGPANYWSIYPEKFCDKYGRVISARVRDHLTPL